MATVQVKQYKCYSCGEPIIFNGSKKRLNPDGTVHECNKDKRREYQNSNEARQNNQARDKKRQSNYWRYFWAFGRGAEYKKYDDNDKHSSSKDKKERRKKAREAREEYKQQYYNESLGIDKALEILGIIKAEFLKLAKNERLTAVKQAYRKLALKFHPDRNKEAGASQKFIEATEAFELIQKELYNI